MAKATNPAIQKATLRRMRELVDYLITTDYVDNPDIPDEHDFNKVYQFIMERVIFYASARALGVVTFEDYAREIKGDMDYAIKYYPDYLGCVAPKEDTQ